MDECNYVNDRLVDQIKLYSKKSNEYKLKYKILRILSLVCAASIPILSGVSGKISYAGALISLLGILIVVSDSISNLSTYHENWIRYRTTRENLVYEREMYRGQAGPYQGGACEALLVERCEGIILRENQAWVGDQKNRSTPPTGKEA